jgi:signal transduction histidine kinase
MGFSELLLDSLDDYSIEKIREFIGIIFETSKQSYALLENLLEWSRSQTNRIDMKPESIKLYDLAEENIHLLNNNAAKKEVSLINRIPGDASAFADPNMIKTVIRNLISNAIKYTKTKGSITLSALQDNNKVEFAVEDTGIGIKPENLEKLFRIDVNYTTRGTEDEAGTGLGLILCKEFIMKNGGKIWAESEFNVGSSFKFTLPVKA